MARAGIPLVAAVLALAGCAVTSSGGGGGTPTGSSDGVEVTGTVATAPAGPGPEPAGATRPPAPLAGAQVTVTTGGTPVTQTTTDNNGRFRLLVPPGTYQITATNMGIGSQASQLITVGGPVEVTLIVDSGMR